MIYLKITDGEIEATSRKVPLDIEVSDGFFETHPPFCFKVMDNKVVLKDDAESLMAAYTLELEADAKAREEQQAAHQKAIAIADINAAFVREVKAITDGYTEDEINSWDMQLAEATAYNADTEASTPLLDSMIAVSGNAKADLATRILTKADAYSKAFGAALGKKQKAIADLG